MSKNQASKTMGTPPCQVSDYLEVAVWSDEDNCYIGSAPPLVGQSCDRSLRDVAELFRELDEIAEEHLRIYTEDGCAPPSPLEAEAYETQFIKTAGKHILRCRLLDAKQRVVSDGMFQNEGGVHEPCYMPLPRTATLSSVEQSRGVYLRFSSTLVVPIGGLEPLGNGAFKVIGHLGGALAKNVFLPSSGETRETALHLI